MVRLVDLSDDCLMELFEWLSLGQLFKVQRLNKRMKRMATVKIRVKIKAIALNESPNDDFADCAHLTSIFHDQVLVMDKMLKIRSRANQKPLDANFFKVVANCSGVRSIDFGYCELPGDLLMKVVRKCPDLECIKLGDSVVKEDVWDRVLERIGSKIVHFVKETRRSELHRFFLPEDRVLKTVALRCENIKQIDWKTDYTLTNDLVDGLKMLPKSCRVVLHCQALAEDVIHIVDELEVGKLDWSVFGDRIERLASLQLVEYNSSFHSRPVRGVEFVGLKKLDFSGVLGYSIYGFVNCLVASQFPALQEFCFNAITGLSEDNYDKLFRKMASIKKLIIVCDQLKNRTIPMVPKLPKLAAILLLKNLEIIELEINDTVSRYWQPKAAGFTQQLERYVDGIGSLKKLTVHLNFCRSWTWEKIIEEECKRMKVKQSLIEIVLYKNDLLSF